MFGLGQRMTENVVFGLKGLKQSKIAKKYSQYYIESINWANVTILINKKLA